MVACVSPADFNVEESVNTLRYATSARNIKNTATRNVVQTITVQEAAKLRRENELLKQQVSDLETLVKKLTKDLEDAVEEAAGFVDTLEGSSSRDHEGDPSNDNEGSEEEEEDDDSERGFLPQGLAKRNGGSGLHNFLERGGPKKSYEELEKENIRLRAEARGADSDLRSIADGSVALRSLSMAAESAAQLPAMKVKVRMLQDELEESQQYEAEAQQLREELDQTRAEATAARHAADQLTHIVEEQKQHLSDSNLSVPLPGGHDDFNADKEGDRVDPSGPPVNAAWVNLIVHVYATFKGQIRQLGDFYDMVKAIVDTRDLTTMLPPKPKVRRRLFGGPGIDAEKDRLERKEEELELRQRLLSEHVHFFEEKFLEVEGQVSSTADSLDQIRGSVQCDEGLRSKGGKLLLQQLSTVLEVGVGEE